MRTPRGVAFWSRNQIACFPYERAIAGADLLCVIACNCTACDHCSHVSAICAVRRVFIHHKRPTNYVPNLRARRKRERGQSTAWVWSQHTCRFEFSAAFRNSARPLESASMTQTKPAAASLLWDSTGPVLAAPCVKSPGNGIARESDSRDRIVAQITRRRNELQAHDGLEPAPQEHPPRVSRCRSPDAGASCRAAQTNECPTSSHLNKTDDAHDAAVVPSLALELCHSGKRLTQRAEVHPERPSKLVVESCT